MVSFLVCAAVTIAAFAAWWRWRQPAFFSGAVVGILLSGLLGYFAMREATTLDELAKYVVPVTDVTDVTYVPTLGEIETIAKVLQAIPNPAVEPRRREAYEQTRQELSRVEYESARAPAGERTWLLQTRLSPDQVIAFYRDPDHRRGFEVTAETETGIALARNELRLTVFAFERMGATTVAYLLTTRADEGRG